MIRSLTLRLSFALALFVSTVSSGLAQVTCEPGVGGVIPCPCANNPSGLNRGCDNSLATGGAGMTGTGTASLSADTLSITSAGIGSTGPSCSATVLNPLSVLYQGTTPSASGTPFGDGVLCCGGTVLLLNAKPATVGTYRYPEFTTDPSISSVSAGLGDVLSVGATRCYFVAYRDSCPSFCVPSFRNKTNSFLVTWTP
jgi:hypothetical protein